MIMTEAQGGTQVHWTSMQKAKANLGVSRVSEIGVCCSTDDCLRFETVYEDRQMPSERAQAWGVATGRGWTHDSAGNWSCPKCSKEA